MSKHLLLVDDRCVLCHNCCQFVYKRDSNNLFLFGSIDSEIAKQHQLAPNAVALIENYKEDSEKVWIGPKAIGRTLSLLGWPWRVLGWITYVPTCISLPVYQMIAKKRSRIWGTTECSLNELIPKERMVK